jgi:hypothetical protein
MTKRDPFAIRKIRMLESPAMRALSLAARRILDRIEIELARHGGKDNGRLPVTFSDFEQFGIHRRAIGPGIRELEALGFIQVTERGCAGNAGFRSPNLFRITYRDAGNKPATDDWAGTTSDEEAERIARAAREAPPSERRMKRGKRLDRTKQSKHFPVAETAPIPVAETAPIPVAETAPIARNPQ